MCLDKIIVVLLYQTNLQHQVEGFKNTFASQNIEATDRKQARTESVRKAY